MTHNAIKSEFYHTPKYEKAAKSISPENLEKCFKPRCELSENGKNSA